VKTILKPRTRDTRINHQRSLPAVLLAGDTLHEMRDTIIIQNEANFTPNASSPTSPNASRDTDHESRFMQNKPNFTTNASSPTSPNASRARDHEPRFMQNKPNFTTNASSPTSPNASRFTAHERRVTIYAKRTQFKTYAEPKAKSRRAGKPNFTPNFISTFTSKICKKARTFTQKYPKKRALLHLFTRLRRTFIPVFCKRLRVSSHLSRPNRPPSPKNYAIRNKTNPKQTQFYPNFPFSFAIIYPPKAAFPQKMQKISAFCNFLTLTHLTPYTTKTYITFHPTIPFTIHESPKNAKQSQF
jgi:hypothetical protein